MLTPGAAISVLVEKPVAGGWMLARHDGRVVLVADAIPGERVDAQVERIGKGVAYARVVAVKDASADRREADDTRCGGCLYSHVRYARQLALKAEVVVDAFARLGKVALTAPVVVTPSPEAGYRMRARLHVQQGALGFFREGTHELCDAASTHQMTPESLAAAVRVLRAVQATHAADVRQIEISENLDASERTLHLQFAHATDPHLFLGVGLQPDLTGVTIGWPSLVMEQQGPPSVTVAGSPYVTDRLSGDIDLALRRHVLAFFQGNRFLLEPLVSAVVEGVPERASVADLYAGVGVFSAAVAGRRGSRVIAVEGDSVAAKDLVHNASRSEGLVDAVEDSVERFTAVTSARPEVVIVDPPRTGMSRQALDGIVRLNAARVVYVSCDVATLARDTRRLLDSGYRLTQVRSFDLFPNTPHVETVVLFERESQA